MSQAPNLPDGCTSRDIDRYYGVRPSDDAVEAEMAIYDRAVAQIHGAQRDIDAIMPAVNDRLARLYLALQETRRHASTAYLRNQIEAAADNLNRHPADDVRAGLEEAITDDLMSRDYGEDCVRDEIEDVP